MAKRVYATQQKHQAVYDYFIELFEKKRVRYDDCVRKTAEKFFYAPITVENILAKMRKKDVGA